jgi:hypothetical protein
MVASVGKRFRFIVEAVENRSAAKIAETATNQATDRLGFLIIASIILAELNEGRKIG